MGDLPLSFRSAKELHARAEMLPAGPQWLCETLIPEYPTKQPPDSSIATRSNAYKRFLATHSSSLTYHLYRRGFGRVLPKYVVYMMSG